MSLSVYEKEIKINENWFKNYTEKIYLKILQELLKIANVLKLHIFSPKTTLKNPTKNSTEHIWIV